MITSAANNNIKDLRLLKSKTSYRREKGLYTAEGVKLFLEAPKALIDRVYISESFVPEGDGIREKLEETGFLQVASGIFERICDTKTPQGIITVLNIPCWDKEQLFKENMDFILALETIQDPGNLGTIIRTAEAAGAKGIVINEGCTDPYGPKAVRASAGSIFRIPVVGCRDITETVESLKGKGLRAYATHLKGEIPHTGGDYKRPTLLLIGNEGHGLSKELSALADTYIRIPMEGQVESLNASLAAAIIMYEVHRQRGE